MATPQSKTSTGKGAPIQKMGHTQSGKHGSSVSAKANTTARPISPQGGSGK